MILPLPTEAVIPPEITFLVFASLTVAGAILALEAREVIYGAISLGFSFIGVAGLFVLLDAVYLAMLQIAVYIGAVIVLVLFTIMLVRREAQDELREEPGAMGRIGAWLGGIFAVTIAGIAFLLPRGLFVRRLPFDFQISQLGSVLGVQYGVALLILGLIMAATIIGALNLAKAEEEPG